MASQTVLTCDWCGTTINTDDNPLIAKIFLAPVVRGKTRTDHSSYTASMDIGQCCAEELVIGKKWSRRKTREEYRDARKLRAGTAVEKGGSRKASAA